MLHSLVGSHTGGSGGEGIVVGREELIPMYRIGVRLPIVEVITTSNFEGLNYNDGILVPIRFYDGI